MAKIRIHVFSMVFMTLLAVSMKMIEAAPVESEVSKEEAVVVLPIPPTNPEVLLVAPVEIGVENPNPEPNPDPDAIQPQTQDGSKKRFFKIKGKGPGQLAQSLLGSKVTQSIVSAAAGKLGKTDAGCKVGGLLFGSGIGGAIGSQVGKGGGKVVNTFGNKLGTKCENKVNANGQNKNPSAPAPPQNPQEADTETETEAKK